MWREQAGYPIGNDWGNANTWDDHARAAGLEVSTVPKVGAVAQTDRGAYGHVGIVTGLVDGGVIIKEMNYDWVPFHQREIVAQAGEYVYIYY